MAQGESKRYKTLGSSKTGRPGGRSKNGTRRRMKQGAAGGSARKVARPKHRNARYALTIIGRLIQRRIRNSALYEKGVSLVSHISSCSLLSVWSGHGQGKASVETNNVVDANVHVQEEASRYYSEESTSTGIILACNDRDHTNTPGCNDLDGTTMAKEGCNDLDGTTMAKGGCNDLHGTTMAKERCNDLDGTTMAKVGVNSNRNAINKQSENREAKTQKATSQRPQKKAMHLRRKVVSRQGLVARSIGRPKLKERSRPSKKKFRLLHPNTKRSKKLKLLQKRLLKQKQDGDATTSSASMSRGTRRLGGMSDKKTSSPTKNEDMTLTNVTMESNSLADGPSTQGTPVSDTIMQKGKNNEVLGGNRSKRKNKRRNKRTKEALLSIFEAGPSNDGFGDIKEGTNKRRKKRSLQQHECDKSKSASKSSLASAHLSLRNTSADNIHWPSLSETGRAKGLIKEAAMEIVKGKQGGSVTKMTRKRWADIVAMRSREENSCHESREPERSVCKRNQVSGITKTPLTRTWASVAANKQSVAATTSGNTRADIESVCEEKQIDDCKPEPLSTTPSCKKKTRSGSRLAYTDKLWADGPKGKGKPQSSKFYRRHFRDGSGQAKKRETLKSRRKRCQQRRERDEPQPSTTTSQEVELQAAVSSETPRQKRANSKSPTQDVEEQNDWCIDKMAVVYTRPVSAVISLNAPITNVTRQTIGVNRCNNRTVTPSKTKSSLTRVTTRSNSKGKTGMESKDESGTDLCDRMSLISFQSSSRTRERKDQSTSKQARRDKSTPRRKSSKHKRLRTASHSKEAPKASPEEMETPKQRKISLRYRALLREGGSRMDAKAVTEMNTRSKRTEVLQEDKEATRLKQRRQRQQRQQTNHNSQRSPAFGSRLLSTDCVTDRSPAVALVRPKRDGTAKLSSKPSSHSRPGSSRNIVMMSAEPGTSSQTQEDVKLTWRPTDNSGANNSSSLWESAASAKGTERKSPVSAKSAPELTKYEGRISVELLPVGAETLDLGWWNAYLSQIKEPSDDNIDDITSTNL